MKRVLGFAALFGAALLTGCGGDSALPEATGEGRIRAINAIETAPSIDLLIEERLVGSASFKDSTGAREFDDLEYTFNFEVVFPTGRERVASQFLDVVADKDYIFVVSGALNSPTITVIETDIREFDASDTVFEMSFAHFGTVLGDVDVYFAAPGVAPAADQQVARLSAGSVSEPADYAEGDYVLIYTAAGDPGTVLFTSDTLALPAQTAVTIAVFDTDANDLDQVSVRSFTATGGSARIGDVTVMPTVRFFHASMALATADIYADDVTMSAPVVTGQAFGEFSDDIPLPDGLNTVTYTGAGDTATILLEQEVAITRGTRNNFYVIGETDALQPIITIVDRRPVETFVKFSLLHAAFNHEIIDFYLVDADADITDLSPLLFGLPAGTQPLQSTFQAGSYDIYVTVAGEKTVIAGPVRLDVDVGDIVDLVILDNTDPAIADLLFVPFP